MLPYLRSALPALSLSLPSHGLPIDSKLLAGVVAEVVVVLLLLQLPPPLLLPRLAYLPNLVIALLATQAVL